MITERASVLERMTTALAGSGDMDVMGALGSAQQAAGRLPEAHAKQLAGVIDNGVGGLALVTAIGRKLTALQAATSQMTYDQAREILRELVTRLSRRRRWRLTEAQERRVAEGSLLLHLQPSCPHCRGRGWDLVPGTSQCSNRPCAPCGGTGKRPYPTKLREEIAATLGVLGLIQSVTEWAVQREMK